MRIIHAILITLLFSTIAFCADGEVTVLRSDIDALKNKISTLEQQLNQHDSLVQTELNLIESNLRKLDERTFSIQKNVSAYNQEEKFLMAQYHADQKNTFMTAIVDETNPAKFTIPYVFGFASAFFVCMLIMIKFQLHHVKKIEEYQKEYGDYQDKMAGKKKDKKEPAKNLGRKNKKAKGVSS